jgi:serine/threonine protein kinase
VTTPDRVGRYRVVRRIGSGGFATVWLARDEVLDAPVAVKVLADNWAHRMDVRARFEEEARILRRADSDRVVRVHDIGELPDGRPYFVMTYADRGTLADRLADGALPVDAALRYGADIARGLAVLHQVGVIHRDVNPGNVLLRSAPDGTERVLVADLGLAKAAAHGSAFTLAAGTPGYMAPEQARPGDAPLDARADVYALGAVLHHLLTGVPPKQDEPPPPVRSLRPEVPPAVEAVITRSLAIRPGDRYPSAEAVADALDAVGSGPAPASRPRRRLMVAALVALLVLAGAGTAAGLLWARRDVTVATADGTIRLRVPHDWARQVRRSGGTSARTGPPAGPVSRSPPRRT